MSRTRSCPPREFLENGTSTCAARPARRRHDIGMHESTVSGRLEQVIHTPRGLFPMKYFFHSGHRLDPGQRGSSLSNQEQDREDRFGRDALAALRKRGSCRSSARGDPDRPTDRASYRESSASRPRRRENRASEVVRRSSDGGTMAVECPSQRGGHARAPEPRARARRTAGAAPGWPAKVGLVRPTKSGGSAPRSSRPTACDAGTRTIHDGPPRLRRARLREDRRAGKKTPRRSGTARTVLPAAAARADVTAVAGPAAEGRRPPPGTSRGNGGSCASRDRR